MTTDRSPLLAAGLSLLFPGAGQAYSGDRARALLWATPMLLGLVALGLLALEGEALLSIISSSSGRLSLLVFNVAWLGYHLAAMTDAYGRLHDPHRPAPTSAQAALVGLLVVALLVHAIPGVLGWQVHTSLERILIHDPGSVIPRESFTPIEPTKPTEEPTIGPTERPDSTQTASPEPTREPTAAPTRSPLVLDSDWAMAADGRINLLLVGGDSRSESGELGRASLRTDSMILLSIDVRAGRAAMFGFPRNLTDTPLASEVAGTYPGGIFPEHLSALWRRAAEQPERFLGSEGLGPECAEHFDCIRGWRALTGTIQQLAGVSVDGVIAVNLVSFVRLVDALGGVWIDVPEAVRDERYTNSQRERMPVDLQVGCQKLDGEHALAYARSRKQDSDYHRMRRQQYVLGQIRRQFDPLSVLTRLPELLSIAEDNLFTTLDDSDFAPLARLASSVEPERVAQVRFTPDLVEGLGGIKGIRRAIAEAFEGPEPSPSPSPANKPERCPPRER